MRGSMMPPEILSGRMRNTISFDQQGNLCYNVPGTIVPGIFMSACKKAM